MTVYADVLIFLNTFVNFFILSLTSKICKDGYRLYRIILASLVGAAFSLYIFLPQMNIFAENLLKLIVSAVTVLICFGFDSLRGLLRRVAVFFIASFLYGGLMLFIWSVLKPDNLSIQNGIVYLDISPIILLLSTLICYLVISLIRFFARRQGGGAKRVTLIIETDFGATSIIALTDTGNSLTDNITGCPVIIIESLAAKELLAVLPTHDSILAGNIPKNSGFRLLPYKTVGGNGLIPAFRPKSVYLKLENEKRQISNVLIAISEQKLGDDYKAIINPDVLT